MAKTTSKPRSSEKKISFGKKKKGIQKKKRNKHESVKVYTGQGR